MPRERYQNRVDLLQGTLDMLILRAVRSGPQPRLRHQPGHSRRIERGAAGRDRLALPGAPPAREKGLIKSEWKLTEFNQRAKYYRLTAAGQKQLEAERARWRQMLTPSPPC